METTMRRVMVRYKVKADRSAENESYIKKVFEQLERERPAGVRYATFKLDDEGKVWPFDPAASFTLEAMLAPSETAEAEFIVGRSDNSVWAGELIAKRLGLPPLPEPELQKRLYETRAVEPSHALHSRWPFSFSEDGRSLSLTHRTPRPWAHVMANEIGMATMVSNDGEIFSAFGNARQNGLSAFRFDSVTAVQPGQVVYLRDLDHGETDAPSFTPFQHDDATHEAVRAGSRDVHNDARRSRNGIRSLRASKLSR
jgi:cyclic beta-1,2-glucan synthetase